MPKADSTFATRPPANICHAQSGAPASILQISKGHLVSPSTKIAWLQNPTHQIQETNRAVDRIPRCAWHNTTPQTKRIPSGEPPLTALPLPPPIVAVAPIAPSAFHQSNYRDSESGVLPRERMKAPNWPHRPFPPPQ